MEDKETKFKGFKIVGGTDSKNSKSVPVEDGDVVIQLTDQIYMVSRANAVEKFVNNKMVDVMPHTHHISRMMASAYMVMEMRYYDMIKRHEPWRAYDNHLFVDVNHGFREADTAEINLDEQFPLSRWDLFARRLQGIVQRIRKNMDSWGNPEQVGKLWALPRESDDFAIYQVRVTRKDQDDFAGIILLFEPSDKKNCTVKMTLVEAPHEGEFVPLAEPIDLSDTVDPMEQMMRLNILFTQGHLMGGLYESFRDFNS